jgi:hypothetical protein
MNGTVYLLHFLEPIGNPTNPRAMAQHYIGIDLSGRRISEQTAGNGAAIVRHVQARASGSSSRRPGPAPGPWSANSRTASTPHASARCATAP